MIYKANILRLVISCFFTLLLCVSSQGQESTPLITPAPAVTSTATSPDTSKVPMTSHGEEMSQFLYGAVRRAFKYLPESQREVNDPQNKSYHWVLMIQVAEPLTQGDERNFNRKIGAIQFLESLVKDRQGQSGTMSDTISIVPYHFNIFPERERDYAFKQPIQDYLNDIGKLTRQIPGNAQPDRYPPNDVVYRDGHSWRRAMTQMVEKLEDNNMDDNCVIIVLDWNDAEAVPQKPVNGSSKPGDRAFLIDRTLNPKGWQEFESAMKRIDFAERNLAYKRIGGRDYYVGVFVPTDLQPLPVSTIAETPAQETAIATTAPTVEPIPSANSDSTSTSGDPIPARPSSGAWWLLLLLPVGAIIFFILNRSIGFEIEGSPYILHALTDNKLGIYGPGSDYDGHGHTLRKDRSPNAPAYLLAIVRLAVFGKISVLYEDSKVIGKSNCDDRADGMGVDMTDSSATIELCDKSNSDITLSEFEITKTSR